MPLFIVESDLEGNYPPPPMPIISPNTSDHNFEIAILFSVVERSGNSVFEGDNPPKPSGQRL